MLVVAGVEISPSFKEQLSNTAVLFRDRPMQRRSSCWVRIVDTSSASQKAPHQRFAVHMHAANNEQWSAAIFKSDVWAYAHL